MIPKSDKLTHVHSDIRGPLYVEALQMQAQGIPVLKLNTGNPCNFGFTLPESVRCALAEHVEEAVPYCAVRTGDIRCSLAAGLTGYHYGRYFYLQRCQRGSFFTDDGTGVHR